MENEFVTVILAMTVLIGLISIGYLVYLIIKYAILEKDRNSIKKAPMSSFLDESELYEATVFLSSDMEENDSFARLQFTKIADEPSERIEFLSKETIVVGRAPDVDISIEDRSISRRHLRLSFSDCVLQIQDLGTTNGTFLNGTKLAPMLLVPVSSKSIVKIGKTFFTININK